MDYKALGEYAWYVPTWEGNRARLMTGEESAPFAVELRTPAYGYMRKLAERPGQSAEQRTAIDKDYFTKHVRGVRNLTLDGEPVTTGADLWKLGAEQDKLPHDLFLELFRALDDKAKLREGLAEGLAGPSGSV